MSHYRVSASNDSVANRGPQPRTAVLGERSESTDVHRVSDESAFQGSRSLWTKLVHRLISGTQLEPLTCPAATGGQGLVLYQCGCAPECAAQLSRSCRWHFPAAAG